MSASSSSHNLPLAGPSATATYPTQLPQTATPLIETKKPSLNLPKRGYRACLASDQLESPEIDRPTVDSEKLVATLGM